MTRTQRHHSLKAVVEGVMSVRRCCVCAIEQEALALRFQFINSVLDSLVCHMSNNVFLAGN